MHFEAGAGHIGGDLSALDAMLVLHHEVMKPEDVFILAKGHAAGALYITLWTQGKLSDDDLKTFHKDGTVLAGHPVAGWSKDILFATGSLGHGLPVAAGMALGYKLQGKDTQVFCMTSDGEWQEGSNWEALAFVVSHRLTNLTILVDENQLQGFGPTTDIAPGSTLMQKFIGFVAYPHQGDHSPIIRVNGHDHEAIKRAALQTGDTYCVRIILLRTIKGCGVSFMENRMEWHYLSLNSEQYQIALKELP